MSTWTLDTAMEDDIPALLRCTSRCAIHDRHTLLKSLAHGYGSRAEDVARYHSSCMQGLYDKAFQDPKYDVIVARDNSRSVIASVVWARRPLDTVSSKHEKIREAGSKIPPVEESEHSGIKTVAHLEKITDAAMKYHIEYLMPPGHACRYIVSINFDPGFQNRGIGTALINWGVQKADGEDVPCWISSGHDAIGMFERRGLREVGRLDLCLDEWAEGIVRPRETTDSVGNGSRSGQLQWGRYVWTWQERPPSSRSA